MTTPPTLVSNFEKNDGKKLDIFYTSADPMFDDIYVYSDKNGKITDIE